MPIEGAIETSITLFSIQIVDRLSSHFYSLNFFLSGFAYLSLQSHLEPILFIFDGFNFRWGEIFNSETNWRPYIQSLSRLNFELLSVKQSVNEGTSAGVHASFCYLMPLPLALFVSVIYLRLISIALSNFFGVLNSRLTILGILIMLHEVLFLFQSPPDFFIIFDNLTITASLFIIFVIVGPAPKLNEPK